MSPTWSNYFLDNHHLIQTLTSLLWFVNFATCLERLERVQGCLLCRLCALVTTLELKTEGFESLNQRQSRDIWRHCATQSGVQSISSAFMTHLLRILLHGVCDGLSNDLDSEGSAIEIFSLGGAQCTVLHFVNVEVGQGARLSTLHHAVKRDVAECPLLSDDVPPRFRYGESPVLVRKKLPYSREHP